MANFQVVIEGKGAVAAATELKKLLAETGLSVTSEEIPKEEKRRAEPIEAIILTFALSVAASVAAEQINEFIRKHDRSQSQNKIEKKFDHSQSQNKILIICDDKRYLINLPLDSEQDISEEIRKVLKSDDFS